MRANDEALSMSGNLFGLASSIFGVAITLTQVEQGLRIAGSSVGLVIGVLTLASMLRGKTKIKELSINLGNDDVTK
jgi:hypothetical protein